MRRLAGPPTTGARWLHLRAGCGIFRNGHWAVSPLLMSAITFDLALNLEADGSAPDSAMQAASGGAEKDEARAEVAPPQG